MGDEISDNMKFVDFASSIWNELSERFSSINGHWIFGIQKDIHKLEQENMLVELYYHKLNGLWDEFATFEIVPKCTCGASKAQEEQEQRKKLMQFLMVLHDSFTTARGHILMMTPLPSVIQAYSLIKED